MGDIVDYLFCRTQEVQDEGKIIQGWRIPASRVKIIENRNGDTRGGIGDFGNIQDFVDRLTSRRRVFAFYALIDTNNTKTGKSIMDNPQGSDRLRAEFIQFEQIAKKIEITKDMANYLESLRKIDQENVTKFYGLQINDDRVETMTFFHYLVERATLEEFCLDPNFPMDNRFKSSFMKDILRGLHFLHRNGIPHGLLYAATCLIDISWILKLSNFGISNFICDQLDSGKAEVKQTHQVLHQHYICLPPEHILEYDQTGLKPPRIVRGSPLGDMYCVGMIFYTIIYKKDPFLAANSVDRAYLPTILHENRRPFIDPNVDIGDESLIIMACEFCWDRDPERRSNFGELMDLIAKVYPDSDGTLVYQMIRQVEKNAEDLETRVAEKKDELKAEQEKTRKLLVEMLPPTVVDRMVKGEKIEPRKYESATVMFVFIVDFLQFMRVNTPDQVIDFLNEIFEEFDQVIEKNKVYKVETTQETYMAASGVPEEIENHVEIIADTAIEVLDVAKKFRLAWNRNYRVKVKIGFHTGPIATGVIGERAKRFCLFGDTVNVASRMQSNCLENKIQTSYQTYSILRDTGKYEMEERGIIYVKGKGDVKCYILKGKIHTIPSRPWGSGED